MALKKTKAKAFTQIRKQHESESAEDYTELVYELIEKEGEARVGRIAELLGISHVTALRTVKRLCDAGYLTTEVRKPIFLTKKGEKLAIDSKKRHEVILNFLIKLGVPRDIAEIDSEGMEHHISKITLDKMGQFLL